MDAEKNTIDPLTLITPKKVDFVQRTLSNDDDYRANNP